MEEQNFGNRAKRRQIEALEAENIHILRDLAGEFARPGQLAAGTVLPGDLITVQPSGQTSRVRAIEVGGKEVDAARPPLSIAITLEDELDTGRAI